MIVVCGEALVDVFVGADTADGVALEGRVGGSPFNVAVGLARLGRPVAFFGAISRDFLGERLMRSLQAERVDTRTTARVDAPTTLGLVGLDAQGVPSYSFYGARGADRQLGVEALDLLPTPLRALHIGSFATVVEPVASTLRALVERERGGSFLSCDPNVRLNVEPDVGLWARTLQWCLARAQLLKISAEDLALLRPGVEARVFAEEALRQGVRLVVVTHGSAGAAGWTASAAASVPPFAIEVIDTVGAGDAFQAALLAWLSERGLLEADLDLTPAALADALRFASAAAALTCSRRGAALPRRAELEAFVQDTRWAT